jgi:hypothetical protein
MKLQARPRDEIPEKPASKQLHVLDEASQKTCLREMNLPSKCFSDVT